MPTSAPTQEQTEAWDRVEREFRERGFLAASVNVIVEHARNQMASWFELAEEFNRLGQAIYIEATELLPGRSTQDPVAMGIQLMPRILSGFQGSILLVERGMGIEAKTLARVVYEAAFWIGYLHEHSSEAAAQLLHESLKSEIGLFKSSLAANPNMDAATMAQVKCAHQGIDRLPKRAPQSTRYSGGGAAWRIWPHLHPLPSPF